MASAPYRFGEFDLDSARFELRRNGRLLKLERIPMELLILLAERGGKVVSRDEIAERLWGKDVFVDTEHGVNTAIRKIRAVLREDADRPRFLETVKGKGYRLRIEPTASVSSVAAEPAFRVAPASVAAPAQGRWLLAAVFSLLFVFLVPLALNVDGLRDRLLGRSGLPAIHSIAVLPFANLSGDPSQEYLADGMTDELITVLAKNTRLRVVSRTSAMQYKNVKRPIGEIGRDLKVESILEGSIERSGSRVHVNAQLIYAPTDTHLWAESYDRSLEESVSLPAELSLAVAREIKTTSSPPAREAHIKPEANDAYLRARYFWFSGDHDGSQAYFEKAVQLQPDYAAAWGGLADVYLARALGMESAPKEVMPEAADSARKAVELDDSLPEVHTSLAGVYLFGEWNGERADVEALRVIALDPNYPEIHPLRAYILLALNRPDEALQEQQRSTELDSLANAWAMGKILIHQRKFDAAINELRLRAASQPRDWYVQLLLSDAYWFKGMGKESAAAAAQAFALQGDAPSARAVQHAFAAGGANALAEWTLAHTRDLARGHYLSPLLLAHRTARLGRRQETIKLLEDSYAERSPWLVLLQYEPDFDFLHSEPRYRALIKKMGLTAAF